tara:strand:+ start:839 stop:1477 length:639 start_codon:yes stop_codon:yes gene_type:complete
MIDTFLQLFLTLLVGLGLSTIMIVHILYLPLKSNIKEITDPVLLYIEKYNDKFENQEIEDSSKNNLENMKNNILFENTPLGNIIMYYDAENEEYKYYCNRDLSFNFLESVGRKYVTIFNCKSLFKIYDEDKFKEFQKELEEKEEKKQTQKKSVYATFKKYNNKSTKIVENEPILQNRYRYVGKLRDFNFLKKPEIKKEKKMTIQDFLNQIKK